MLRPREHIIYTLDCYPGQKARSAKRNTDRPQCVHNRPALRTRYQFIFNTSRIASISKSHSGTIRLSRPFSVSSSCNRRISCTPHARELVAPVEKGLFADAVLAADFVDLSVLPFGQNLDDLFFCIPFSHQSLIGLSKINHGNSYQSCDTRQG